jgi:protein-S-isoprenylcysteine O-methyltransferase Ste14
MKSTSYLVKHLFGTLVFFAILFVSASRIDYWQAWVYVAIGMVMFFLNYTFLKVDEQLLNERSKPGDGANKSDKLLLGLLFLTTISMYVTAGLDSGRFHWSLDFHWSCYLSGILLTIAGQLLFLIAQKQNKYFSSTIRIQTDREHLVCSTGLYCVVRHPAYMGSIIQAIGFPFLFGSLWSIIPVSFSVFLMIARTILEDAILKKDLKGYVEYSERTRYKLIPYVW